MAPCRRSRREGHVTKQIKALVVAASLGLSGCAGIDYAVDEYSGVPLVMFEHDDHTFRVFDKVASNKLMITPTLGNAAGVGFVRGLTLGLVDNDIPEPVFHEGASAYLLSTGRACAVSNGVLVIRPQWEFRYQCQPAGAKALNGGAGSIIAPADGVSQASGR